MALTRHALLISNPGEIGAENYCKGVYADIRNYKQHLTSAEGGAWEESEIKLLDRPTVVELRNYLKVVSSIDYVFIMYSGHGWYSNPDRDQVIVLRKGEQIGASELSLSSKKRTVVLDCCSEVHEERITEDIVRMAISKKSATRRTANRENCKRVFYEGIKSAALATVKIVSADVGEVATDDDIRGGRYSASLINCTEAWIEGERDKTYNTQTASYSIVAAHECAAAVTRHLSSGNQNPRIEKPRSAPYFPFAVFG